MKLESGRKNSVISVNGWLLLALVVVLKAKYWVDGSSDNVGRVPRSRNARKIMIFYTILPTTRAITLGKASKE